MNPPSPNLGSTMMGCALGFSLGVLLFILLLLVTRSRAAVLLTGVIQLAYIIPLFIHFRKRGKSDAGAGLVVAASILALLNAACAASFLR